MGVSIAQGDSFWYIPVGHLDSIFGEAKNIDRIPPEFFESLVDKVIVNHNSKFDLHVVRKLGFDGKYEKVDDTMIMSHFIDENRFSHDLDSLSKEHCTVRKNVALGKALAADWDNAPIQAMAKYAEEDAVATLQLHDALNGPFDYYRHAWENFDREFMYLLMKMEAKGLLLDKENCRIQLEKCHVRMAEIELELGFSPSKPSEYIPRLFNEVPDGFGLEPLTRTQGGKPQVNTKFLERTNHPVCGLMLEHRKIAKLASSYYGSYLDIVGERNRLHPNFKQHGTVTGRLSCEYPNMQQIPKESDVKHKLFHPEPGKQLWEVDFSALEPKMSAIYAQDQTLLPIFQNNQDFHQVMADIAGVDRFTGKVVNLTCFYGGYVSLMNTLNCSEGYAKKLKKDFDGAYKEVTKLKNDCKEFAQANGYIEMFSGRRRHYGRYNNPKDAFNSLIQGSGFEVMKRSMLLMDQAGVDIRNTVHDSVWVMVDSEKEIPEIERIMSEWTIEAFGLHLGVESTKLR